MKLTDTHCHLDFNWFDEDRQVVLERAAQAGVERMLIPGLTATSSRAALQLAESRPGLFAAVGVHPNDALTWDPQTLQVLRQLALSPKVVAIGEIGLDFYRERAPHDLQERVLDEQLALAAECGLPVIIHLREAEDAGHGPAGERLLDVLAGWVAGLRSERNPRAERPGVLHSFGGNPEMARQAIDLGFFIGVTGPVTFKNAIRRQEVVRSVPLERILIETDAPFLAPAPHRGQRNEPAHVRYIVEKIAGLLSRNQEEVAAVTFDNAARLFSWEETV